MSLLALEDVTRRAREGARDRVVLREVSLRLDRGELLAIWGTRRSGRSTLLRVAAGIDPPDSGIVYFAGKPLRSGGALGRGIGYCQRSPYGVETREVLDELMLGTLALGVPRSAARARASDALTRTGIERCATHRLHELDGAEAIRVAIARTLTLSPALLVIDEPTRGVDLLERDRILALLRSLADDGVAVLMSTGDATALLGANRVLSLDDGELRGSIVPELADVVPLRRASA